MFSGRNHLLWKLTPGKATAILADPEVAAAISSRNKDAEAAGECEDAVGAIIELLIERAGQ